MTIPSSTTFTPATAQAPLALVIGSGFGGLAAAIRLAVRGWRVQVLEKLDAPGQRRLRGGRGERGRARDRHRGWVLMCERTVMVEADENAGLP